MDYTVLWTAALTAAAAIGGVLVTVVADGLKDRRRLQHEGDVREQERQRAAADRRRTFELDNLLAAYDGLWLLARKSAKVHTGDRTAAQSTAHGYGGTQLPEDARDVDAQLAATSQAVKSIRLILDDQVRHLADQAHEAMSYANSMGVMAKIQGRGPVSAAEGEAAFAEAVNRIDAAMKAIADRVRVLMAEP